MRIRNILASLALATSTVASADVVVFGNDTVVTDSMNINGQSLDMIIMSMNGDSGGEKEAVGTTLDYMAELFMAGYGHTQIINGTASMFKKGRIPKGDVPINVSEFHIPAIGPITSHFGPRKKYKRVHRGIDLGIHKGDTIRAAFPGSVAMTGYDKRGYGYYVILTHPNGLQTLYAHLDSFLVVPTTSVDAGMPIAIGGMSGNSTGPHLHFETRYMAVPIDPADIIDFRRRRPHNATYIFNKKRLEEEATENEKKK